jgi:hypothetical protein
MLLFLGAYGLEGKTVVCTTDKAASAGLQRLPNRFPDAVDDPGIHMRWGLVRSDGTVIPGFTCDALKEQTTDSQWNDSVRVGLGAFTTNACTRMPMPVAAWACGCV